MFPQNQVIVVLLSVTTKSMGMEEGDAVPLSEQILPRVLF